MTIPDSIVKEALREAFSRQIDDVALVSIPEAAKLLDVTPVTARKLLGRGVDVGGRGYKVRLADIRRLIPKQNN